MAIDRSRLDGDGTLADTVLVSNRGPLAFHLEDGRPVLGSPGGGLAGSLHPLVVGTGATWVACALDEGDRAAVAEGLMADDGLTIELVEPDPQVYNMAYNVVSNATLWFCHHHLFDAARRPRSDHRWKEAWEAYREFNELFALRVAKVAPESGRVLVQDYHLALMGSTLARLRPDLKTVHFTHTPFADPSVLRMLPTAVGTELLSAMSDFSACGFHTARWADAYRQGLALVDGDDDDVGASASSASASASSASASSASASSASASSASAFVSPLSVDADRLRSRAGEPAVAEALARLEDRIGGPDRQVIVRVDRMELSKNLLRGFWAFEELLERQPQRHGRVVFVALAYPTRQGLPEYLGYQNEVESTVARINARWATANWTPILLEVEDDYPRSLAALSRYDVLLVNPVRDGLNLVAKEGPLINTRHGVLALSREAGAFDELGPAALEVNPFDVAGTSAVLARALDMEDDQKAAWAGALTGLILARRPADWLDDQLRAAN